MRVRATIRLLAVASLAVLASCASGSRSADDLRQSIGNLERQVADAEHALDRYAERLQAGGDVAATMRIGLVNTVLRTLSTGRKLDAAVRFLPTRNLIREQRSTLGIEYTNVVDIDSGYVRLDLSRFEVLRSYKGGLMVLVDIRGTGSLAVSGRYAGIPFISSPDVSLALTDSLRFEARQRKDGAVMLVPGSDVTRLRVRFSKRILGWDVGYDHEITLNAQELIPEIPVPLSLRSMFSVPVGGRADRMTVALSLEEAALGIDGDGIHYRSRLDARRITQH